MAEKTAKIISYLFAPPFNLMFVFIILSIRIYSEDTLILKTLVIAFLFGLFLPVVVFVYLRKKDKIANDDATIKEERTLPYAIGIFLAVIALLLSEIFGLHHFILALWIAYIFIQIIMIVINFYWKISAHLIGIGIPFAVICFLFSWEACWILIFPIVIGWARLELKVHNLLQIVAGFLLGALPTFFILSLSVRY